MKIRMMQGMTIALFATLMGASGTASAIPSQPCTASNQGQLSSEQHWDGSSRVWMCDSGQWLLYAICDRRNRCTVVI